MLVRGSGREGSQDAREVSRAVEYRDGAGILLELFIALRRVFEMLPPPSGRERERVALERVPSTFMYI